MQELEDNESDQLQTQRRAYLDNRICVDKLMNDAERLPQVETELTNARKDLSYQREDYQRNLADLMCQNTNLLQQVSQLGAEKAQLQRATEEKDKTLTTLERKYFETNRKLGKVESELQVEVERAKKRIECEFGIWRWRVECLPNLAELAKSATRRSASRDKSVGTSPKTTHAPAPPIGSAASSSTDSADAVSTKKPAEQPAQVSTSAPPPPPPPPGFLNPANVKKAPGECGNTTLRRIRSLVNITLIF